MNSFVIGQAVRLRYAPYGAAGRVIGFRRGQVLVQWPDLQMNTKHAATSLLPAGENTLPVQTSAPSVGGGAGEISGDRSPVDRLPVEFLYPHFR
ncbi:MAG: hypothetical protein JWQ49_1721 [Edaphobacter sp.]|nr:hypothetical protein [Edaphobacter sp.]